jgi:FKBP-type peptidyl-prolyl cis-trans isomerase SlyD
MEIAAPCVVSLTWTLDDAQGTRIGELTEPVEFFYGGDDLLAAVEHAIEGHEAGYEAGVHLEPEQAFGDYNPALVCFEQRTLFPENLEPGMQFEGLPEGAETRDMPGDAIYTVTEIYPSHVVLDGNHPLAGIGLQLHLKVHDVREATEEEIDAGSVGEESPFTVLGSAPREGPLH